MHTRKKENKTLAGIARGDASATGEVPGLHDDSDYGGLHTSDYGGYVPMTTVTPAQPTFFWAPAYTTAC